MCAELIDKLGGPKQVAELIGRSTCVERQRGNLVFALRAASESREKDSLNIMVLISPCRSLVIYQRGHMLSTKEHLLQANSDVHVYLCRRRTH
jgi:hypothetical protein